MEIKLKPCPFCGSRSVDLLRNSTKVAFSCSDCKAVSAWFDDPSDAINAWNKMENDNNDILGSLFSKLPVNSCVWRDSESEWGAAVNLGGNGCKAAKGKSALDATLNLLDKLEVENATFHN